jgi:hypothetical protein
MNNDVAVDEGDLSEVSAWATFSKSAHPDDDAEHGEAGEPTAHGGVYRVDGHGRPEQHAGGGELNFSCRPPGPEPPPTPRFLFPLGWPEPLSVGANALRFFRSVVGDQQPNRTLFPISTSPYVIHNKSFCWFY